LRLLRRGAPESRAEAPGGDQVSVAKDVVGTVTEQLPSALYRVKLDAGPVVTAHTGDRMDRNFIRLLVGDRVRLELSPVDPGRGRVVEKMAG
jgi:translation initiation factor IF-1